MKKSWRSGSKGPGFQLCHVLPWESLVRFCTGLNLWFHTWKRADDHIAFAVLLRKSQRGEKLWKSCWTLYWWLSWGSALFLTALTS